MRHLKTAVLIVIALGIAPIVGAGMFQVFSEGARHTTRPPSFFDTDSHARETDISELTSPLDSPDADVSAQRMPDISGPMEPAELLSSLPVIPGNAPHGKPYIVISTEYNRLWLMRDDEVLRTAVCATGKGDTLHWEEGGKTWVFNTPTGEFTVQHKTSNPRWIPPEWHYVEQGEDPPDWLGRAKQADYDMLGDAAINFGNEYNIHGTLFEGLLGRSITHGCVRIGSRDLAYIYPRVGRGTKVFIY